MKMGKKITKRICSILTASMLMGSVPASATRTIPVRGINDAIVSDILGNLRGGGLEALEEEYPALRKAQDQVQIFGVTPSTVKHFAESVEECGILGTAELFECAGYRVSRQNTDVTTLHMFRREIEFPETETPILYLVFLKMAKEIQQGISDPDIHRDFIEKVASALGRALEDGTLLTSQVTLDGSGCLDLEWLICGGLLVAAAFGWFLGCVLDGGDCLDVFLEFLGAIMLAFLFACGLNDCLSA
ncbi:MAG: hypothetical protein HY538_01100 [Deltaproteobacteria bacterium]|nr:hypothetical protein [Deltaproteobacteria bacterium]